MPATALVNSVSTGHLFVSRVQEADATALDQLMLPTTGAMTDFRPQQSADGGTPILLAASPHPSQECIPRTDIHQSVHQVHHPMVNVRKLPTCNKQHAVGVQITEYK
jgi:hypothetical protein